MNRAVIEISSKEEGEKIINNLKHNFTIEDVCFEKSECKEGYYLHLEMEMKNLNFKMGRKRKFTDQEKEMIKMYRFQGQTITELAKSFNCSVGLIHKIINE